MRQGPSTPNFTTASSYNSSRAQVEASCTPDGIGIVRLMGRHAGFIAAHAALASGDVDLGALNMTFLQLFFCICVVFVDLGATMMKRQSAQHLPCRCARMRAISSRDNDTTLRY
jgi:6-phosphofructokinase